MADYPYQLKAYITREQNELGATNTSQFKNTSFFALGHLEHRCIVEYEKGVQLLEKSTEEEQAHCMKLYKLRRELGLGSLFCKDLMRARIKDEWVIVPAYLSLLEEVRKLEEVFA